MDEKRFLRYMPSLNQVTGSMMATIVMLQLEYWFEKIEKKQFYKFLEPCSHEFYRVGDSWVEELGVGKTEFRTAFAKIGKVYKSKSAFIAAEDKFGGKLYLSYYDRMKKLTYYIRNDEKVSRIEHKPCLTQVREPDLHRCESLPGVSVDDSIPYQEITTCFNDTCPSYPKVKQLTPRLKALIKALWKTGKVTLSVVQKVFCLAEQSDFLSGRAGGTWRATLEWLLRPDKFELVLGGKYSNKIGTGSLATSFKQQRFNTIAMHNFDFEALQRQESKYIERKLQALREEPNFLAARAKHRGAC